MDASLNPDAEVMSSVDRRVLYPEEVARLLGIHVNSVYALLSEGTLPAVKAGRRWLIPKGRFEAWLAGDRNDDREA